MNSTEIQPNQQLSWRSCPAADYPEFTPHPRDSRAYPEELWSAERPLTGGVNRPR
jgi:hypothetical protein